MVCKVPGIGTRSIRRTILARDANSGGALEAHVEVNIVGAQDGQRYMLRLGRGGAGSATAVEKDIMAISQQPDRPRGHGVRHPLITPWFPRHGRNGGSLFASRYNLSR